MSLWGFLGSLVGVGGKSFDKTVQVSKASANEGVKIIYGTRRVPSVKVFKTVSRDNAARTAANYDHLTEVGVGDGDEKKHKTNAWLHRVDAWAHGPIAAIENFWIDGDPYTATRFTGKPYFRAVSYYGADDQDWFPDLAQVSDRWTSAHKGQDIAYSATRFFASDDKPQFRSEPELHAQIKGRKIYDPRKDSTQAGGSGSHRQNDPDTWEWSDNPALCLLDYLTASYGRDLDWSEVDLASFMAGADSCDEIVSIPAPLTNTSGSTISNYWNRYTGQFEDILPGQPYPNYRQDQAGTSQKRLRCNIVLDPKDTVLSNAQKILEVMRASLPFSQGKYKLVMNGQVGGTVMSITEDHIIGGIKVEGGGRSKRVNSVTIGFKNRNKDFQEDTVTWPAAGSAEETAFLADDQGKRLHQKITVEGVTDFYQAQDLAEYIVRDSRAAAASIQIGPKGMLLEPGDVVDITHTSASWSEKWFIVRKVTMTTDGAVTLDLTEYDSTVYSWSAPVSNEPLQPDVDMVDPWVGLPAVSGLAGNVFHEAKDDGSVVTGIDVTWNAIDADIPDIEYIEVAWKKYVDAEFSSIMRIAGSATSAKIQPLSDQDNYDVRVSYRNRLGVVSAVSTVTVIMSTAAADGKGLGSIALLNEIAASDLAQDLQQRIDRIDEGVSELNIPSLLDQVDVASKAQAALDRALDGLAEGLTGIAARVSDLDGKVTGAGIIVNQEEGKVEIHTLKTYQENNDQRVGLAETRLTQAEANINLKASVTYVNDTIAAAVLDPADLASLTALQAQVNQAEVDIDANTAAINLKASQADFTTALGRITTAEANIDANAAAISLKAGQLQVDTLEGRVTTAEVEIAALDGATISQAVLDTAVVVKGQKDQEESLLWSLLLDDKDRRNLNAQVGFVKEDITARVDADKEAFAASISNILADLGDTKAQLASEASTRATQDSALAQDITDLEAVVNDPSTGVAATAAAVSSLSGSVSSRDGDINANTAAITALESTVNNPSTGVAATASSLTSLSSQVTANTNSINSNASAITALNSSLSSKADASAVNSLSTTVSNQGSSISANATSINAVSTTVNGHTSSISAQATSINGLEARYTVKVDANGAVAGFGLAVSGNSSAGITSEFYVNANRFAVIDPSASNANNPFVPFAVSGGVCYLDTAMIRNGDITNAKIGNAAVTTLKVGANQITQPEASEYNPSSPASLGTGYVTYLSDSITISGNGHVQIDINVDCHGFPSSGIFCQIKRGSTVIFDELIMQGYSTTVSSFTGGTWGSVNSTTHHWMRMTIPVTLFDTPAAGGTTYSVALRTGVANSEAVNRITMIIRDYKR